MRWKSAVCVALVLLVLPGVARAQEPIEAGKAGEPEEAERRNEVAVFLADETAHDFGVSTGVSF